MSEAEILFILDKTHKKRKRNERKLPDPYNILRPKYMKEMMRFSEISLKKKLF